MMKKLIDEEIQSQLDAGESILEKDDDVVIYQLLFKELDREPKESLPLSFAAKLVRKIKTNRNRKADILLYIVITILLITGLAGGFICLFIMDKDTADTITRTIIDYKGAWLLIITIIIIGHIIDWKSIRGSRI